MAEVVPCRRKLFMVTHSRLCSLTVFTFVFSFISKLAIAQAPNSSCSLDFRPSDLGNASECDDRNWGGFLARSCCGVSLEGYLYALGRRTNRTGLIYINSTEQIDCLEQMKEFDKDVFMCGIEKLTSGGGGCSDFNVNDILKRLGNGIESLQEDCKLLGFDAESDSKCPNCLQKWEDMGKSLNSKGDTVQTEIDVCRYALLVWFISRRIDDDRWVHALFRCLGQSDYIRGSPASGTHGSILDPGFAALITGLMGVLIVMIFVVWMLLKKRSHSEVAHSEQAHKVLPTEMPGCGKLSLKDIYAATKDLNMVNFIGEGTAGKVYRGVLSDGRHVAVKHIIKDGYVETFVREVTSLSHVKHPNLVNLVGYCGEEDECFLVYELCSNGNLSEWLFGTDKILSWIQRLEIAIDSARGLWFLHTYAEGCIVHRDVKPINILLDHKLGAKLSDFGLSKVIDVGQSHVSSEVRGTFGYVDPEYRWNHHVNPSSDVYSFGIVLLQILSGMKAINLSTKKPISLQKRAKLLFREGNMQEFADPKLNGEYSSEAFAHTLRLALSCTAYKHQRPTMRGVIASLEEALIMSSSNKTTRSDFSF